jgi:hypothetical protein
VNTTLRTAVSEARYQEARECDELRPLILEEPIVLFKHWMLVENRFPYDMAFATHHLLLPKRVFANATDMYLTEHLELQHIKDEWAGGYDCIMENIGKTRSVKDHYHLHLLKYHPSREAMSL